MNKKLFLLGISLAVAGITQAQTSGGITPQMLQQMEKQQAQQPMSRGLFNAIAQNNIDDLAKNFQNQGDIDTHFSIETPKQSIHDQKSSGRCWMFSGLNVLRAAAADKHGLGDFRFSQNYNFFYDQLEKANLFLQAVIDTRDKPFDDREVDWLFSNPISDGGTFTGVANLVMKYGVVPANVMPETLSANNTSAMATQLKTLLRRDGLKLRETPAGVKEKDLPAWLQARKTEMLTDVYHVLALCLGVPMRSSMTATSTTDRTGSMSTFRSSASRRWPSLPSRRTRRCIFPATSPSSSTARKAWRT